MNTPGPGVQGGCNGFLSGEVDGGANFVCEKEGPNGREKKWG